MNFEFKKINWEPGKTASQLQLMTLSVRKKSDEDVPSSYTHIADDLQVYGDGTIINPPLIKNLEYDTSYVFRIVNNDPAGGQLDMVYTTPQLLETDYPNDYPYYPYSELLYWGNTNYRDNTLPPNNGAYFSLEYRFDDWFSTLGDAVAPGVPVWVKIDDLSGIKISTEADRVQIPVFQADLPTGLDDQYALGVHFYVAAADLPDSGIWPLIALGAPPENDGILVYVNCDTKKIHWRQQKNDAIEEIISADAINVNAWNKVLVFRKRNIDASQMWLNGANTFSGMLTAAGVPDFSIVADPLYVGGPGGIFSNFYYTSINVDNDLAQKYQYPPYPVGVLEDYDDPENKYIIPWKYTSIIAGGNRFYCILPPDVPAGHKKFYIENSDENDQPLEIVVAPFEKRQDPLEIDFSADEGVVATFRDRCYHIEKGSDDADGGVSPQHIYIQDDLLVLEAHGDRYDGNSRGLDSSGGDKDHEDQNDPLYDTPWITRVGAMIATKDYCGYGSYIVEAKLPREMGVAPVFWISHYAKVKTWDPRFNQLVAQGLHIQGEPYDGYYVNSYNKTGLELPSNNAACIFESVEQMLAANYHIAWAGQNVAVANDPEPVNNGTWRLDNTIAPAQLVSWTKINAEIQYLHQPRKNNARCINWQGLLGTGNGIGMGTESLQDEFFSMLSNMEKDVWDDAFHEFRFDWYADRVEFYVDGELIQVNRHFVPDIPGRWMIGLMFPSAADPQHSWLVDPAHAWAGPMASWKYQKMFIKRMVHTPFTDQEAGGANRMIGETYPNDWLRAYVGPLPG